MNKRIYLITGPSGSGKTTISDQLTSLGHASIDADSTQGISFFVNQNGKPVPYPAGADAGWWETHHYVWELDRLKKLIEATNPTDGIVFVAGNAANINKGWDIFDAAYYLDLPEELMIKRMAGKDRENSFGHRIDEQAQLVRWVEKFKADMLGLGAVTVDATKSVEDVTKDILARIKKSAK